MKAIAFAEAGQHGTAQELLTGKRGGKRSELRAMRFKQRPDIRARGSLPRASLWWLLKKGGVCRKRQHPLFLSLSFVKKKLFPCDIALVNSFSHYVSVGNACGCCLVSVMV